MGYPGWGVRLPCDTPPVGLMHTLAALVYRGNNADAILNVGCIGCQRHAACAPPRRWALVITMVGAAAGMARHGLATRPYAPLAALQRVSRSGVGIDYFVVDPLADPTRALQIAQALQVRSVVVVTIVGAHEHIVLTRVLEDVGEIIVRLARDVEAVGLHRVLWELTPALLGQATRQIFEGPGHTLRGDLDEDHAQRR